MTARVVLILSATGGLAVSIALAVRTDDPVVQVTAPLSAICFAALLVTALRRRAGSRDGD